MVGSARSGQGTTSLAHGVLQGGLGIPQRGGGPFKQLCNIRLAGSLHDPGPLEEFPAMAAVVLYPVREHNPQFIQIIHIIHPLIFFVIVHRGVRSIRLIRSAV
ncbi:hypothetical protein BMS3Bbin14_01205 [bacterium BMS3Bbin14]|nr:hypothetical protein BMS3Abin13_01065 [bacterium BMS3Abin13]GBE52730.1 hypothetical protein BMS3Bbin14_01205 [bacterium BMS3Bbin14]